MPRGFVIPKEYHPTLNLYQTEKAIKLIKDFFQMNLALELNLQRMTAPLFVMKGTGINDDLNGVEKPVAFKVKEINGQEAEVVQSLAKWKRLALARYKVPMGHGIYTDMNAIRPDETLDNIHSIYVDQWDWEKVISKKQRNIEYLKETVRKIYECIRRTEVYICNEYPHLKPTLPDEITFIHSEQLLKKYPKITPAEREDRATKEYGAIFVIGIGAALSDGKKHDGRAPDYDDWDLNGDIIVWNPLLNHAYELSSMGIRVDEKSFLKQLKISGKMERKNLYFHKKLLAGELPLSIGGGIGQSRLCMLYLRKAHIGEIQTSLWSKDMVNTCSKNNIFLL